MSTGERRAALLWLSATTVIWGLSFTLTREAMLASAAALERAAPGSGAAAEAPTLFLFLRFGAASVLGCALPGALAGLRSRAAMRDALLVGAPNLVGFLLQSYGLVETSASLGAFLTSIYVVLVPVVTLAAGRRRPPLRLIAGIAFVTAGIAVLCFFGGGATPDAPARAAFGRGEMLSLLCAFAFALQVVLLDGASRRTDPIALALATFAITAAGAGLALALSPSGRAALSPAAVAAVLADPAALAGLLYSVIASSLIAIYVMYRYQRAVSPTRAAIVYAAEPAFAALFAVALGREPFRVVSLLGYFLVLIGNGLAELRRRSP